MISCCASFFSANQRQFSDAVARRDLTRYRTRGPDRTTRLLRDAILGAGHGRTVLDVGAGIGALSFELLAAGAERVTAVEAAPAYIAAARGSAAPQPASLGVLLPARPVVCAGRGAATESEPRPVPQSVSGFRALGARYGDLARATRLRAAAAS